MVLLLPFDASLSQSCEHDIDCKPFSSSKPGSWGPEHMFAAGTVFGDVGTVWYTAFMLVGLFAFVFIPLAYFWYETDDEEPLGTRKDLKCCTV